MDLASLDLGCLGLQSDETGLRLRLASSAQCSPSAEDDVAQLQRRLTDCKLNANNLCQPWFSRSANFRLEISLSLDCGLPVSEQATLVEVLSEQLRFAKLWQQLHLLPSSVESSHTSSKHLVTVCLDHAAELDVSKRRLHALGADVPYYDTKPPAGVYTALIDCVQLDMAIHSTVVLKSKRRRKEERPPDPRCPLRTVFEPESQSSDAHEARENDFTWDPESDYDNDDTLDNETASVGTGDPCLPTPLSSQPSTPVLRKRRSSTLDPQLNENRRTLEEILDLVDAAVRTSISGPRTKLPNGVKMTESESFQRLADIVPSLLCSGHLLAVSSRAVFLPTIAHALGNICATHANSKSLATKSRVLKDRVHFEINHEGHEQNTRLSTHSACSMFSVLLWRTMQTGLRSSGAGKGLQSITTRVEPTESRSESSDQVLDTSQEDILNDEPTDPQEHDLLFEGLNDYEGYEFDEDDLLEWDNVESAMNCQLEDNLWESEEAKYVEAEEDLLSVCSSLCSAMHFTDHDHEMLEI